MQHDGLQVAQDRETPVQVKRSGAFSWRYAYARSADTRKVGDPGQDYLTFRHNDDTFAFVLCDGVSQSFFGDLAARYLGDGLMNWLWNDLPDGMDERSVRVALANFLRNLAAQSSGLVKDHPLPEGIPLMLREVLEQKRAIGSETTFACGRIDLSTEAYPDGRLTMAWMGDSRMRLWGPNGERTSELGETFITEQRWSTHEGPVRGEPHILVAPIQVAGQRQVAQLMVYSDGLSTVDRYAQSPSNKELKKLIDDSGETAISDDISFLELWLEQAPTEGKKTTIMVPTVSSDASRVPVAAMQSAAQLPILEGATAGHRDGAAPLVDVPSARQIDTTAAKGPKSATYQADSPSPVVSVGAREAATGPERPRNNSMLIIAAVLVVIVIGIIIMMTLVK